MGKVYIGVMAVRGHKLWGWRAVDDCRQAAGRLRAGHARPLRGGGRVSGCRPEGCAGAGWFRAIFVGGGVLDATRRGQDPSLRCGVRRGGKAVTGGYGKVCGPGMPGPYGVAVGEVTEHYCVCCRIRRKSPCVSSAKAVYYYYNSILGGIAMMKIYRTQDKQLTRVDDMNEGAWICLTNPTDDEVRRVAATLDIEPADIVAATDPEESARISLEDGYTVIIVDIPVKVDGAGEGIYTTIPLGILLTQELIVTVCSTDTAVIGDFAACRVKGFSTRKKMRFVYQLLYRAATMYQQELHLIDRRRQAIEKNLAGELKDSDLMELHGLESTLVYFATSLRANATVLDRLTRYKRLEQYPDDRELLDDVIVEIRQAIEMTSIYRDDIKGTRELFSSILDNRLNNAMKYLTSITLLMAVPTVISGLYGMNVQSDGMPFANTTAGFAIVLGLTLALCVFAAWVLHKKHML